MKTKESYFLGIRVSAWVEIFCFFFISFLLAFIIGIDYNYFSVSPHPFWIVVILISAQYGTLAGLLAALTATIVYLSGTLPKQNILQEWNEYFYLLAKTPLLWFVTALILGELRMKHIRERDRLRILAYETEEREKRLAESYDALKRIKERLEMRIASEMPTTLMIVEAFKNLESAKKNDTYKKASELIKVFLAPEKFSIFILDSNGLKCVETAGWEVSDHYTKNFASTSHLYQEIVEKKRAISLTTSDITILGKEGILAIPIQASPTSQVIGMIKIEQIPFQRINVAMIESLRHVGNSIGKVYEA